ncbi:MAG TPA: hypothetical protein VJH03_09630 [Blastocatellia bacterium]|nr:hypothetical protein [Blastocatellia bacterium]
MKIKKAVWLIAAVAPLFLSIQARPIIPVRPASSPSSFATCFCKFTARPGLTPGGTTSPPGTVDVLKITATGYTQGLEKGKCQSYCKGQWAARDKTELAKLYPQACGNMDLKVWAAIGTADYELVNAGTVNVGGVGNWTCPQGMWVHTDNRTCVQSAGCRVQGIPDQDLKGGYFFWKGDLYKLAGPATFTCKR